MTPVTLQLKHSELEEIRYRLSIEEPRVIRRANILNCLHLGYVSSQIAQILNVDPKTVTNVGNAYLEDGLESALYDEKRAGRPIESHRGHGFSQRTTPSQTLSLHAGFQRRPFQPATARIHRPLPKR